jgi:hypothetical protein
VTNPIGRSALGLPMIEGHVPCFNNDGSLDIYIQANPPPDPMSVQYCNKKSAARLGARDGAVHGAILRCWVSPILGPTLQPGNIVLWENLSVHKVAGIKAASRAASWGS